MELSRARSRASRSTRTNRSSRTSTSTRSINPFAKGHTLVIPKEHYKGLLDTDDKVLADLITKVKKIAAHVALSLGCDGFNILQNNGDAAGQTVRHVHFHIIPRWSGDPLTFENKKGDMDELAALAEKIRM